MLLAIPNFRVLDRRWGILLAWPRSANPSTTPALRRTAADGSRGGHGYWRQPRSSSRFAITSPTRLSEKDRQRLVEIVKASKGRPSNLSDRQRKELKSLLIRIEPGSWRRPSPPVASPASSPRDCAAIKSDRPLRDGRLAAVPFSYLERRFQTFTMRESRWMPTLRLTRCRALSTVLVSQSSFSPITS